MKVSDALAGVKLLYVETAPLIYFTESRAGYVEKMREILRFIDEGQIQGVTSSITLTETLAKPLRDRDTDLVKRYRDLLYRSRGLLLQSITPAIGDAAAELRAKYNLRTPDAVHVAAAIDVRCDAFLTNDTALQRVSELRILILEDMEIDATPEE